MFADRALGDELALRVDRPEVALVAVRAKVAKEDASAKSHSSDRS
jgi:hypothetical protein